MKKLIEFTLEGLDIYDVETKDVMKYLKEQGVSNFRYDDSEDYGSIICLICQYLNENDISY